MKVSCLKVGAVLIAGLALFFGPQVSAEAAEQMELVAPQKTGGKPLMEALDLRKSNRNISDQALSEQELSNLLWAAFGANRDDGRRTVPTARNKQNVKVYVVLKTGIWEYDGIKHILTLVKAGDVTSKFGSPLTLVYVAPEEPADVSGMHVGSIYQNVGLYCASADLACIVKTTKREALADIIDLPEGYKTYVIELVGKPD